MSDHDDELLEAGLKTRRDRQVNALGTLLGKSRAFVRFLNDASAHEKARIEQILAERFNDDVMVGGIEAELAREPEGWRVVSAWGRSDPPGPMPSDDRPDVIDALRSGGIALAH